jgi:general secretion pathway protein G
MAVVWVLKHDDSPVPPSARQVSVVTQMACFKTALDEFQLDNGFYPTGTNGLMALLQRPPGATNWHGPYIEALPKDPWGRDYRYEYPGKHTPLGYPYDLWSLGGRPVNSIIANYEWGLKPL